MRKYSPLFLALFASPCVALPDTGQVRVPSDIDDSIELVQQAHLATNADGGFISKINGYAGRPVLRRGMRVVIEGQGFQARPLVDNSLYLVSMSVPVSADRTETWLFKIRTWTDTRIVTELPPTQRWPNYDGPVVVRIQGVKPNNFLTTLVLTRVHFVPG